MDAIKLRDSYNSRLNRFEEYLLTIKETFDATQSVPPLDLSQLTKRLEDIRTLLQTFDEIQLQIENVCDDPISERETARKFETRYYSIVSLADSILDSCKPEIHVAPANSLRNSAHNLVTSTLEDPHSQQSFVKLPTIALPSFGGNSEDWLNFKDLFISLIHNNENLTDVHKLHYLRAVLKGSAADAIKNLTLAAPNYSIAWDNLVDRYDNEKVLIHNHVKALFNIEGMTKESSVRLRNLIDGVEKNLRTLDTMVSKDKLWEVLMIFLINSKLDSNTLKEFENHDNSNEIPTYDDLIKFLKKRAAMLETLDQKQSKYRGDRENTRSSFVATQIDCSHCNGAHMLYSCEKFKGLKVQERRDKVKDLRLCFNCLSKGHSIKNCKSRINCGKCKGRHHSLLHFSDSKGNSTTTPSAPIPVEVEPEVNTTLSTFDINDSKVLLPTALVQITGGNGKSITVKALLDSGSMSSFITADLCKVLALDTTPSNVRIQGITNSTIDVNLRSIVTMRSPITKYQFSTPCLVIPCISSVMTSYSINIDNWSIPKNISLADPTFHHSGEISILLGSNCFWKILQSGQMTLGAGMPILQRTALGWIVSGPVPSLSSPGKVYCHLTKVLDVQKQLARFWELEETPSSKVYSREEDYCESYFLKTTRRDHSGRFIVSIPLKQDPSVLGESFEQAERRFYNLEKRLKLNPTLKGRYCKFMQEYLELGHMSPIVVKEHGNAFYLPHHCVVKEDSTTTKLRVVFDGSAATSNGISLNDIQCVGPVVQSDLFSILLRFRGYTYAFCSDIEKMYRQVLIADSNRPLQRIIWRFNPEDSLRIFQLNTVTYGTSSASFLATRCLKELGINCSAANPHISKTIQNDFYVDDLLSGADSLMEARNICKNLTEILKTAGFRIRKWVCNEPTVLEGLSSTSIHPTSLNLSENTKTLGLLWSSKADQLRFTICNSSGGKPTKRKILSEISQIFDPLGLVAPCVMAAKFLLQSLWLEKISWDDLIPLSLQRQWLNFRSTLPLINEISLPRRVIAKDAEYLSLHAFCDASIKGYGACVYIVSTNKNGSCSFLLCSKGKVAPLKQITIPKLELCGALTLTRLVKQVTRALDLNFRELIFWSDSTIVLSWIKLQPNQLKPFVANRIAEIQDLSQNSCWRHVPTKSNPADILSRGVNSVELKESKMWFYGPDWLVDKSLWPPEYNSDPTSSQLPELKRIQCLSSKTIIQFPFTSFSSLTHMKRVVAYCIRFKHNCCHPASERRTNPLNPSELNDALIRVVRMSQNESFPKEIQSLQTLGHLKSDSKLKSLTPFLDKNNVLRVGGRLFTSNLSYVKKHPMLVSGKHPLAKIILTYEHIKLLHAGPQLTLFSSRQQFWVTSGRTLCKNIVHKCIRCFRAAPNIQPPLMGNLPRSRIEPSYPFENTGVDYAGPFMIKDRKGRGCKLTKGYIAVFVCFSTKCVHLELVSDLSTENFILCLRRFASRRGRPKHIYSDNGSNFVGAKAELKSLTNFLKTNDAVIADSVSEQGIHWHLVPAHAPHFGGLWEAAVKSSKHHLKRILTNVHLTFEEFYSILTQVEAVLNSRPLTPLSSEPEDLEPLTPSHFLVGRQLTTVPDPDLTAIPLAKLSRFQLIQRMQQHFWKRWSLEYIHHLQQRTKWKTNCQNLKVNDLVLIKDDQAPPTKWKLGRITTTYAGPDGIVRVADIKTSTGIIRRAFSKICPLPANDVSSDVNQASA